MKHCLPALAKHAEPHSLIKKDGLRLAKKMFRTSPLRSVTINRNVDGPFGVVLSSGTCHRSHVDRVKPNRSLPSCRSFFCTQPPITATIKDLTAKGVERSGSTSKAVWSSSGRFATILTLAPLEFAASALQNNSQTVEDDLALWPKLCRVHASAPSLSTILL